MGIDHVALAATDIATAVDALHASGIPSLFIERDLPNLSCKKPLLARHQVLHDIAVCRPGGGGVAIEVTVHGPATATRSASIAPLLRGRDIAAAARAPFATEPDWRSICRSALDLACAPAMLQDLNAPCWHVDGDEKPSIEAILLSSAAWEEDLRFWCDGMRAKIASQEAGRWARLEFASPVAAWRGKLLLAAARTAPLSYLDSAGFSCLAFWSSAIDDDLPRLLSVGGHGAIEPFDITINQKPLRVVQLRTPGGILVELLQLRTTNSPNEQKTA